MEQKETLLEGIKEIIEVDVELISVNPFQPRKEFDEEEIGNLAESIRTHGLIQPIIVRKIADHYQVVAGERRLRAVKKIGMSKIQAILTEIDGVDVAEISLIENIQRKNLNCIEESQAFNILKAKFGMTADEIAKRIGKSRPYVSNIMRLSTLPQTIKDALMKNKISMGHGRSILALDSEERQEQVFHDILRKALSVRQTEELVAEMGIGEKERKERKRKSIGEDLFDGVSDHYREIKQIVADFKKKGGKADIIERETDEYLEIIVRISK